jgi:hypothetical protein
MRKCIPAADLQHPGEPPANRVGSDSSGGQPVEPVDPLGQRGGATKESKRKGGGPSDRANSKPGEGHSKAGKSNGKPGKGNDK